MIHPFRFFFIFALFIALPAALSAADFDTNLLREGDIIFQESESEQARALQLATKSRYTHVGIVLRRNQDLEVLEAVQPVKWTSIREFTKRGVKGHFVVKRIAYADSLLEPAVLKQMKEYGNSLVGRDYDLYFEWSNKRIYCTELVWKMYKEALNIEVGKLQTFRDFDLSHPYVQAMIKKRWGTKVPYDEKVISVDSMFASPILQTVGTNN